MEEYYYKKLLQAICFTNNVKIYLNNKLLEPIFIEHFTALLLENSTKGMVNEQMRYNLLAVANYLRYNGCAELANECILLINDTDTEYMCWQEFLYNEYQKSKMPQNVKFDIYNEKFITCLFESLELDYLILISLLCDDETFKDKFVPKLMLSEFYFASCNRMVKEIPKLFENEETLQRIVTIHLCNKEMKNLIDEEQQEQYKQILKVGNKFVRKVIK